MFIVLNAFILHLFKLSLDLLLKDKSNIIHIINLVPIIDDINPIPYTNYNHQKKFSKTYQINSYTTNK